MKLCFRLDSWPRFVSPDLKMRYVAAALLAALGGGEPSAANIKSILRYFITVWSILVILFSSSVGIEADGEKVDKVVAELAGKNIEELITEGTAKLGTMPSGGGGGAAGAAAADSAPAAAEKAKEPEPEEEEEDDDMGFGLFD